MKLITDEKALNLSIQLLENDKKIQDQLTSQNNTTKEELIELNDSTKQELLNNTELVKQELQTNDEEIKKNLDTKAPMDNPDFTGKVTVDGENVALFSEVDNKLRLSEPYIMGSELVANGYGLIIDAIDDNTNRATYYTSGQKKYIDFPSGYSVVGGAVNENCLSSSIVMNNGNVNIIQGGSDGDGSVSQSNIVINGGSVKSILGGGYPDFKYSGKANHTGSVNIIIKNITSKPSVFGGGYSYASVGNVNIDIYDGEYDYVTAGGSNGYVGYGCVNIYNGIVNVLQGTNHGYIGNADLYVKGGTVKSVYAGMEPGGSTVGSFGNVNFDFSGGSVSNIYKGDDASGHGTILGTYCDGVIDSNKAELIGLTKKEKYDVTQNDVKECINNALTIKEI